MRNGTRELGITTDGAPIPIVETPTSPIKRLVASKPSALRLIFMSPICPQIRVSTAGSYFRAKPVRSTWDLCPLCRDAKIEVVTGDGTSDAKRANTESSLPFVGRSEELTGLRGATAEDSAVVYVSGAAGIGKTRIVDTLCADGEHEVLRGRAWRGAYHMPYLPWTQVLSAARQYLSSGDLARYRDLAPLISRTSHRARFEESESTQHVLGLALGDYLREVSTRCEGQLLLVLEDLHYADRPSIALAVTIARQRLPMSFIVTCRPTAQARLESRELLELLRAESEVVELPPLSRTAIAEVLSERDVPPDRLSAAERATSGSPLLLEQWLRTDQSESEFDYGNSIALQLVELKPQAQETLKLAALAGETFDLTTIAEAAGFPVVDALDYVEEAKVAGLVGNLDRSLVRYEFHHQSVQEVLEEMQTPSQRARGHARLLQVLLARQGSAGEVDVSVLAAHASEAAIVGDAQLAADLNLQAGQVALDRAAPETALMNFQRAVDIAAAAGLALKVRLNGELGLARAHKISGSELARPALLRVLEACEKDPDSADVGIEAALLLPSNAGALGLGADRDVVVVHWLEWALEAMNSEPSTLRGRLLLELGIQSYARSAAEGEALVVEAAEIAESVDDSALLVQAVCHRHWFRRFPGDASAVLELTDQLESRIRATDTRARLSLAGLRFATLLRLGRFTEALTEVHTLEVELSPLPPVASWSIGRWRATIHYVRGEHHEAEAAALGAFSLVEQTRFGVVAFDYLALVLSAVMHARMEHERIIELTASMVSSPSPLLAIPAKAGGATILAELGRDSEAAELLAQIPRDALSYRDPYELSWLPGAAFVSQAAVALKDSGRSREALENLEAYREEWIVWGSGFMCVGPVALHRGQAALVAGDHSVAEQDLGLARDEIIGSGARLFEPALLCAEADLALVSGDTGSAVQALTQASTLCTEMDFGTAAAMLAARAIEISAPVKAEVEPNLKLRSLRREGSIWTIEFDGETGRVAHLKGMTVLELLLAAPRRQFHALELSAVIDNVTGGIGGEPLGTLREASAPILDDQAYGEYRKRIRELQEEIDESESSQLGTNSEAAHRELDALLDELQRATGIGGKARQTANNSERARVRITKSIRTAVARISEVAPAAGHHLTTSLSTGAFCGYDPGTSGPEWSVVHNRDA